VAALPRTHFCTGYRLPNITSVADNTDNLEPLPALFCAAKHLFPIQVPCYHRTCCELPARTGYIATMASVSSGRHGHSRVSLSESAHSSHLSTTNEKENEKSDDRTYPGSLHRGPHAYAVPGQFRSMLEVDDVKNPKNINSPRDSSTDSSIERNSSQTAQDSTHTVSDQANHSCSSTAANGVAAAAPTRAPVPVPNGKAVSPASEIPQSVSSTDPKVAAQQASDMRNIVRRKLTGYVGFANLPNQWHRKSVRKGFNFNVMVVGTF
jgi:septin 7